MNTCYRVVPPLCGIQPASASFASVRIEPHLGSLESLKTTFPHPQGNIEVEYHRDGSGLAANIVLPGSLTGSFWFDSRQWPLHPGANHIRTGKN